MERIVCPLRELLAERSALASYLLLAQQAFALRLATQWLLLLQRD